jgi:hypothetical protein
MMVVMWWMYFLVVVAAVRTLWHAPAGQGLIKNQ